MHVPEKVHTKKTSDRGIVIITLFSSLVKGLRKYFYLYIKLTCNPVPTYAIMVIVKAGGHYNENSRT